MVTSIWNLKSDICSKQKGIIYGFSPNHDTKAFIRIRLTEAEAGHETKRPKCFVPAVKKVVAPAQFVSKYMEKILNLKVAFSHFRQSS